MVERNKIGYLIKKQNEELKQQQKTHWDSSHNKEKTVLKLTHKTENIMKAKIIGLFLLTMSMQSSFAQQNKSDNSKMANEKKEQEIIQLSKQKWQWMADKNIDKLEPLFDNKSKFVHMSGTWKKDEELDIIKTGKIWYKNAKVHDVAIETFGKTAILWNRITLEAIVRGSEVVTEFTVTETYQKQGRNWKLLALTFSSVRDTHQIQK